HDLLDRFLIALCLLLRWGTGELIEEAEFHRYSIARRLPERRYDLSGKEPQSFPVVESWTPQGDDDVAYPNIEIGLHLALDCSHISSQDDRTHLLETPRLHLGDLDLGQQLLYLGRV